MKSYGILMSAPMVCAWLAGLKWKTRRLKGLREINIHPDDWRCEGLSANGEFFVFTCAGQPAKPQNKIRPPYGYVGDEIYFKETWSPMCKAADPLCWCETEAEIKANHYVEYRADTDNPYPGDWPEDEAKGNDEAPKWKPSLLMPRKHARIIVSVIGVRVVVNVGMTSNLPNTACSGFAPAGASEKQKG